MERLGLIFAKTLPAMSAATGMVEAWGTPPADTSTGSWRLQVGRTEQLTSGPQNGFFLGSWADLDLYCRIERTGAKWGNLIQVIIYYIFYLRLAVLETRRENDCLIKYLLDKYEDQTSQMFAIGLRTETSFPGVYQWNRVDVTPDDQDAATLSFTNWLPG